MPKLGCLVALVGAGVGAGVGSNTPTSGAGAIAASGVGAGVALVGTEATGAFTMHQSQSSDQTVLLSVLATVPATCIPLVIT